MLLHLSVILSTGGVSVHGGVSVQGGILSPRGVSVHREISVQGDPVSIPYGNERAVRNLLECILVTNVLEGNGS